MDKKKNRKKQSRILQHGYINVYSRLTSQENRQLFYNRSYKTINPHWDNTLIRLCSMFDYAVEKLRKKDSKLRISVFDAGCGHGNYVIDERRSGILKACGVDLSSKHTAKNVCLDEIKHANLEAIPYDDASFDIVFALWVLEHLANPEKVFYEIRRVLKPNGFFLFTTPNKQCYLLLLKSLLDRYMKIPVKLNSLLYGRKEIDIFPTFYRANDIKTLTKQLLGCGFRSINIFFNYDPGYTSFNRVTFFLSNTGNKILGRIIPQYYKSHLIGSVQKRVNAK